MKKFLLATAAIFVMAIVFVSCSSNSPKASADKFLTSFWHMDYEAAKTVATEDAKKQLDMMQQISAMIPDSAKQQAKKIKIDIKDVKEEGDNATVTYTVSNEEHKADDAGMQTLKMVKQNGKWLAAWSKNDMGGGANSEPAPVTNEAPIMDTTAPGIETAPMDTTSVQP